MTTTLYIALLGLWFPTANLVLLLIGRSRPAVHHAFSLAGGCCFAYVGIASGDTVIKILAALMLILSFHHIAWMSRMKQRLADLDKLDKQPDE